MNPQGLFGRFYSQDRGSPRGGDGAPRDVRPAILRFPDPAAAPASGQRHTLSRIRIFYELFFPSVLSNPCNSALPI
jgi:hypothetical protein